MQPRRSPRRASGEFGFFFELECGDGIVLSFSIMALTVIIFGC